MDPIFKKLAQQKIEKHDPNYSGQFPVKLHGKYRLDTDYVRDFLAHHPEYVEYFESPSEYYPIASSRGSSYILHGDGSLSRLPSMHDSYVDDVNEYLIEELYEDLSPEDRERYIDNSDMSTHKLIHHLFDGGIRVYAYRTNLFISAFQIPTDQQLDMIKEICDQRASHMIETDIALHKNGEYVNHFRTFNDFEDFKSFVLSLRHTPQTANQEAINRIQLLQSFRGYFEPEVSDRIPKELGQKPKPASELGRKLTREEIKDILGKYPPLRNMEKSARNRAIIKIAERLDENNCYQQSDWVMEMVNEV